MAAAPKYVWEARLTKHRPGEQSAARLCGRRAVALDILAPAWVASTASTKDGEVETWRTASETFTITRREVVYTG